MDETILKLPLPVRAESVPTQTGLTRTSAYLLGVACLILIADGAAFLLFREVPTGALLVDAIALAGNSFAIACCVVAASKARGPSRAFWILFGMVAMLEMIGNAGWDYCRHFQIAVPHGALFPSIFYRLAATPMAIALFLSDDARTSKFGALLDTCMVVGLVGVTTYQVQMAEMNAHDPKIWQLIGMGTAVNAALALAAVVRYVLQGEGYLRSLFGRQAVYLSVFFAIAVGTSIVDAYFPAMDASDDLIWIVPSLTIAALAVTWKPVNGEKKAQAQRISRRASLLCFNLTLAAMVTGSAILGLRLVDSSRLVGMVAVSVVLFAFAVRSALMQDTQEQYLEDLQKSRAELEGRALYDELTGLPNRRLLSDRLSQVIAIAEREHFVAALFYLDLDGFKPVNDRYGHAVGDLLLKQVAQRLLERVRSSDTVARMGGDEFIWVVPNVADRAEAHRLRAEMQLTLGEPYSIQGQTINITSSIGVALYPEDSEVAAGLIHRADTAMYSAKHTVPPRRAEASRVRIVA